MVPIWANEYKDEIAEPSETIQAMTTLTERLEQRIQRLHNIADAVYDVWTRPLTV